MFSEGTRLYTHSTRARNQRLLSSIVPGPVQFAGQRNKTAHSVLNYCEPESCLPRPGAKKRSPSNLLGPAALPRQHALRRSKGMANEMAENSNSTLPFVRKICKTMGSCCLRRLGLLVRGVTRIIRAKGRSRSIGRPGNAVCTQKLRGSMLPQENVLEFDAVRWLLRLILGPKTSLLILALVLAW